MVHAVAIRDDLQHWGDAVGGAGCGGQDLIGIVDVRVVDAVDDVLDIALARSGEQNLGDALGFQVLAQSVAVAPHTCVIHHDGVIDAVLGVVDLGWVACVDDLNRGAVGVDDVVFFVHRDGAVECPVDGIAAQQRGALLQVACSLRTDNDSAQAGSTVGSFPGDEDPGEQSADTAKAVEHHVARLASVFLTEGIRQLLFKEAAQILALGGLLVAARQSADIDRSSSQVHRRELLEHRQGLGQGHFLFHDASRITVGLDDVDVRVVHQQATKHGSDHVLFAVQLADQWKHLLRQVQALVPFVMVLLWRGHRSSLFVSQRTIRDFPAITGILGQTPCAINNLSGLCEFFVRCSL